MGDTFDKLKQASQRALGGPNPHDAARHYGVDLEDTAAFIVGWIERLAAQALEQGLDPESRDFVQHVALGLLFVGIDFGRATASGQPAAQDDPRN